MYAMRLRKSLASMNKPEALPEAVAASKMSVTTNRSTASDTSGIVPSITYLRIPRWMSAL